MKTCVRCKTEKNETEFNKSKRFKDGLRRWCKTCERAASLEYRNLHREQCIEKKREWAKNNPAKVRTYSKMWYETHKEESKKHATEWGKKWRAANPIAAKEKRKAQYWLDPKKHRAQARAWAAEHREEACAKARAWARENPGRVRANVAARDARINRATPPWADKKAIAKIYIEAAKRRRETGGEWEVDHIVPLVNKRVCGLHVANNLRVITREANRAKSNNWEPTVV